MKQEWAAPRMLIGHSLGGAAVLQASHHIPSVEAVATIGAPCNPEHVTHHLVDKMDVIERQGKARVKLAGRTFTIKKQFLDDLKEQKMNKVIESLGEPLLIFHSPIDQTVGIDNAAIFISWRSIPKVLFHWMMRITCLLMRRMHGMWGLSRPRGSSGTYR